MFKRIKKVIEWAIFGLDRETVTLTEMIGNMVNLTRKMKEKQADNDQLAAILAAFADGKGGCLNIPSSSLSSIKGKTLHIRANDADNSLTVSVITNNDLN